MGKLDAQEIYKYTNPTKNQAIKIFDFNIRKAKKYVLSLEWKIKILYYLVFFYGAFSYISI